MLFLLWVNRLLLTESIEPFQILIFLISAKQYCNIPVAVANPNEHALEHTQIIIPNIWKIDIKSKVIESELRADYHGDYH